jgi:hypothetical protein
MGRMPRIVWGRSVAGALTLACAFALMPRPAAGEDFDRTFAVRPGTGLDVRLFGGEVIVRASDRGTVRIRATHFKTDSIDARLAGSTLAVRARAKVGSPHAIDLAIDVPSWMPVTIAGTYVDVSVSGSRASVSAETVRGDVRVTGGKGGIVLKTIEGEVTLEDAAGRASLTAVNNGIRVRGFEGDLVAVTVNGAVRLDAVRSPSVDVGTVGGDISWTGPTTPSGRYQFATHTGDIDVSLGRDPSATVSVRLFDGQFRSAFAGEHSEAPEGRKRFTVNLGDGAARLDVETFRGTISLRR